MPGAHPVYTSAQAPGLIYDVLAVNPAIARAASCRLHQAHRRVGRVVRYINDPKTQADAVRIMAARVGLRSAQYQPAAGAART